MTEQLEVFEKRLNDATPTEWDEVAKLAAVEQAKETIYFTKAQDNNVNKVVYSMLNRAEDGMHKYGVTTSDNPLDFIEWLRHLQEELMDASIYIERTVEEVNKPCLDEKVLKWHSDRGLLSSPISGQVDKLEEEFHELWNSIKAKKNPIDDIGDMLVVMINIAARFGLTLEDCLAHAWEEIKDRKGKYDAVSRTWVKEN